MKLEYVHDFIVLAETGNYLRAAEQLLIAQSSLSRHIQLLEEYLGVKLFERTTRSIELSEYGHIFFPFAKEMIKLQNECNTAFFNHKKDLDGRVTIGCISEPEAYNIPDVLARFASQNSKLKVDFWGYDDLQKLYDHTVDFIFYRKTHELNDDLVSIPFNSDCLVAVLPNDHSFATRQSISLSQLKNEKFLFLPKSSGMYNLCLSACYGAGFRPNIAYSGSHVENIIALVKANAGIALLTKKPLLRHNLAGLRLVDISPKIITPICLVYLKTSKLSPTANHFIQCVKSCAIDTFPVQSE